MREVIHVRSAARAALITAITVGAVAAPASMSAADGTAPWLHRVPVCRFPVPPRIPDDRAAASHGWEARLDARGSLVGYELRLGEDRYAAGRRAFLEGPFQGVLVAGARSAAGTRLHLIDVARRCVIRRLDVGTLVYGVLPDATGDALYLSVVEPRTRRELGVWRHELGSGRGRQVIAPPAGGLATAVPREVSLLPGLSGGVVSRWCAGDRCEDVDTGPGGVPIATSIPGQVPGAVTPGSLPPDLETDAGGSFDPPQPVPSAVGWDPYTVLQYRWHGSETPPQWMRGALRAASDDASTKRANAPAYVYDADAGDSFRYAADFPAESCSQAIACASKDVPEWWTVRMRVQGYDFRWGSLRWCQSTDADGCFDVERTALHELGHIGGSLMHPQDGDFRLAPDQSVMDAYIPAKPKPGSVMHAFGPCDVASLQMRFDVPSLDTTLSRCLDLETRITLGASRSQVTAGETVRFTATLSLISRSSYMELSANRLNLRSVQLRRRLSGTSGAWSTLWMSQGNTPGTYLLALRPGSTYEYQAVFKTPDDEGLRGSSSNVITVRVTGTCPSCPTDEEV